jgi:hypothetical protein
MRSRAVRACVLASHSHCFFRAASAQQLERPVEVALLEHQCVPFAEPLMYQDLNPPEG